MTDLIAYLREQKRVYREMLSGWWPRFNDEQRRLFPRKTPSGRCGARRGRTAAVVGGAHGHFCSLQARVVRLPFRGELHRYGLVERVLPEPETLLSSVPAPAHGTLGFSE